MRFASGWLSERPKGSDLTGFDSATGLVERPFNPREQSWADHFELQGPPIVFSD
jgi:hypothetical protein